MVMASLRWSLGPALLLVGGAIVACGTAPDDKAAEATAQAESACRPSDHCDFLSSFGAGACNAVSACREAALGAGCHGSSVASPSDARFCESAVSQPNPQQACQIWGPSFNCVWTEGQEACVSRQDGLHGNGQSCSLAEHCTFFGQIGQCGSVPACKTGQTGGGCHGSSVASPSDARFCESAVSQPNPQQACQIWGPSFNCVWSEPVTACVPREGQTHASSCTASDHCAFFGELGQCGSIAACRETALGAGCHGSAVASPSDARFCESAVSQPNPQQACQIWGPSFNCVWTEGQTACTARDSAAVGHADACSLSDHCAFLGELGDCQASTACKQAVTGAGCHGSAVASPSDAQFCESAVSQPNPQQACQIWGASFNCVWTEGQSACVPR
jgi:hypothetical protein